MSQLPDQQAPQGGPSAAQAMPNIIINNVNTNTVGAGLPYPLKSKLLALILCFFLGAIGIHRFYVGKTGTGIIYFFTLGLLGIGVIFDFVMILLGSFRDKAGYPLR